VPGELSGVNYFSHAGNSNCRRTPRIVLPVLHNHLCLASISADGESRLIGGGFSLKRALRGWVELGAGLAELEFMEGGQGVFDRFILRPEVATWRICG
jgi:hypothetical protein